MARKKSAPKASNGVKSESPGHAVPREFPDERPAKKAKLLDDSDEDMGSDDGAETLKVNEEYARRFNHNHKRAEMHRLEEKYGKSKALENGDDSESDSEDDVEEDDDGELATEAVDAAWLDTLNAIRSKDPRVYNPDVKFFEDADDEDSGAASKEKKEKPMTLKDYHTKNLLEGKLSDEDDDAPPKTYAQEQEEMRQDLVKQMHAADLSEDDDDDFLVTKSKPEPIKERVKITERDVENADKDPETFLSNFMASRAWVPTDKSHWQPLESDDEEEEARAEEYEDAYNRYFEDPAGSNEKIVTYARDAVASTTVRREEKSGRRKAREAARAKREAEKREREEELARLRKLKIEEMEEKVKKIRKTAGLKGREFQMDEWADILEADWSDDQWDQEMRKRFGDAYYDEDAEGGASGSEDGNESDKKKKKPKKPTFDDDIDIKDLIPDFDDEADEKPAFTLSSDEDEEESRPSSKSAKKRKQERAEAKSSARRDRRLIEKLVDSNLEYEATIAKNPKAPTRFRYRETSPTDFGLTPRDILLASDAQLNEFAGLKKLAAFRDPVKKKKDKKQLSKKARLRQWRAETFGDADGPKGGFETILGDEADAMDEGRRKSNANDGVEIREGDRKGKKKSRKRKADAVEA